MYLNMETSYRICLYYITVQSGKSVQIDFPIFSIPDSSFCSSGSVKIYEDRLGYNSNLKATFCGNGSRTFQSYSNKVIVEFIARSNWNTQRFYATYYTIDQGILLQCCPLFAESFKICNHFGCNFLLKSIVINC